MKVPSVHLPLEDQVAQVPPSLPVDRKKSKPQGSQFYQF